MGYAWNHSSPATGAVAMYDLKELLKAQGWSVVMSGDGLAVYSAVGDVITGGGVGANGMANTRAWFRITDPAGVKELTIQRGTLNYTYRIKFSYAAKFTGGAPDPDQTPSATDEVIVEGGGTDAAPSYGSVWNSTDGNYRFNACADDAAKYGFWATCFPIGGGIPNGVFLYEGLADVEATDGDDTAIYTGTSLTTASLSGGTAFSAFVPALVPASWQSYRGLTYNDDSVAVMPGNLPTSPLTVKDAIFPILLARRSALGSGSYKGRLVLTKWPSPARTTGDTLTVATARDRVIMGDVSLPWDGTVPAV